MVVQNIAATFSDCAESTCKDAEAMSEAIEIQKHLHHRDEELIASLRDAPAELPAA